MVAAVFDDDGSPLDAHFSAISNGTLWTIFYESRGGTIGTPTARNVDYGKGLELLITRAADLRVTISDGFVESYNPALRGLSPDDRRLRIDGLAFPMDLGLVRNPVGVARLLRRAQKDIGSERVRGGGNTTRRIRLVLAIPDDLGRVEHLEALLSHPGPVGSTNRALVEEIASELNESGAFNPESLEDARKHVSASIAVRLGQPDFRRKLLEAYAGCCAISGCAVEAVLEAAHIIPYRGTHTNHVQNGLLLRADLHSLFDRGLIGIDPRGWTVALHPTLHDGFYGGLEGVKIRLPMDASARPSAEALLRHLRSAGLASPKP